MSVPSIAELRRQRRNEAEYEANRRRRLARKTPPPLLDTDVERCDLDGSWCMRGQPCGTCVIRMRRSVAS